MIDNQRPTTSTTTNDQPDRLTVREMAARLGISENAVRLRIKRGTLRGEKVGDYWFVLIGDDHRQPPPTTSTTTSEQVTNDQTDHRDEMIEQLRSEVSFLRAELEARRESEEQLRIIVANLSESVRALPAPPLTAAAEQAAPATTPTTTDRPARIWWRFWQRDGG